MIDDSADESLSKDVVAPMSREKPRWSAPPRVPTHLVPKPDVYDTLETGSAVTVLRAPQGYGKSAHVVGTERV